MGTRRGSTDSSLEHLALPDVRSPRAGVVIPLVHYLRRNAQLADEFVRDKFVRHRVTAIGEMHRAPGYGGRDENICVRLFLRDLVLRLYQDRRARLRFLAIEADDDEVVHNFRNDPSRGSGVPQGHWSDWPLSRYPRGTRNRSARWYAQSMSEHNLGFKEALLEISRQCSDEDFEVVGIDHLMDVRRVERADNDGRFDEFSAQDRRLIWHARESAIVSKFRDGVLSRIGRRDRALVYYGSEHLREERLEREPIGSFYPLQYFLERLAESGDLPAEDVYTIVTCYEGIQSDRHAEMPGAMQEDRPPVSDGLIRTYDLIRAEFPIEDMRGVDENLGRWNLGFDIDDAEDSDISIHFSPRHDLGDAYDGYLFFRDLNQWAENARLLDREEDMTSRPDTLPLRITRVVPSRAPAGNTVFVYGHVLNDEVSIRFGEQESPSATCINENVMAVEVPPMAIGESPVDVVAQRASSLSFGDGSFGATQTFTLTNGFQCVDPSTLRGR